MFLQDWREERAVAAVVLVGRARANEVGVANLHTLSHRYVHLQ